VSELTLTARQVRYTNKAFWRNPAAAFFTFVFPLMFLVIFATLLGSGTVTLENGREFNQSTYYVASMAVFSVITACYTNLAIGVTFQRDAGILKRTRGTPLPGSAYLGARVIHVMIMSILLVVICAAFGWLFYDADLPTGMSLIRSIIVVLVGSASFAALGLDLPCASIGPVTSAESRARGLCVVVEAETHDREGLVEAVKLAASLGSSPS